MKYKPTPEQLRELQETLPNPYAFTRGALRTVPLEASSFDYYAWGSSSQVAGMCFPTITFQLEEERLVERGIERTFKQWVYNGPVLC